MYMKRFAHEKSPRVYKQAGKGHLAPPVSATSPLLASSIMAISAPPNNSIPIQPPIKRGPRRPRGTRKKPQPPVDGVTPVKRRPGRPPGMKLKQPLTEALLQPTEAVLESHQMLLTKPPPKRRKSSPLKRMELSVTLSVAGVDISPAVFPLLQDFLQSHCETGVFAVERGGDHSSPHPERVSGNVAAHEVTEFASFIPLVPVLHLSDRIAVAVGPSGEQVAQVRVSARSAGDETAATESSGGKRRPRRAGGIKARSRFRFA
ncbi:hypothetical protein R1sor_013250 [Riccia sorocarpa]|uniref:Uncharacterized protein n=1 Tax=Riccia sorocarpa TaxID=122646 RepID=A0ABD3H7Z6_9MARC